MVFEGINFNQEWAKSKSVEEFVAHEAHHPLTEAQLIEAYELMNPKPVAVKKAQVEKSTPAK